MCIYVCHKEVAEEGGVVVHKRQFQFNLVDES